MKIIISPAKKMNSHLDFLEPRNLPALLTKTETLMNYLKSLSTNSLQELFQANAEITRLNQERYQTMDLTKSLTPAILSYEGIQYKYMAPQIFEYEYFDYIEKHLRILSGFYGILKPFDGVTPYRLELQAKLKTSFCKNLYDYWQGDIYDELISHDNTILNLASKEYSKIIEKYLTPNITFVSCIFGELIEGKVREKGVYVKMARGQMVRFMAENSIINLEDIKGFDRLGFSYNALLSDEKKYVFLKQKNKETKKLL